MALTITQASAVNRLIDCLQGRSRGEEPYTETDLRGALTTLAEGACKALGAGVGPDQIEGMALPNYTQSTEPVVTVESVRAALRDAHRNDSAADAVAYVSDLVGWDAADDPELAA